MKVLVTSLLTLVCIVNIAQADVVTMKNGDRVTGSLVTIKGGNLQLKSEILGTLTIPMAQVATCTVDKPVAVVIKGQEPVQGALALSPSGDWQVTANGQTQTFTAAKVDLIMPEDTFHKTYEGPKPKPWQAWKGGFSLGESLERGNQDTNTFTTTLNAVRERPETINFERHFRSTFDFAALLSHAEQPGSSVTSRTLTAGLREDYLFSMRGFGFGMGQVDHISSEGLYLRQTYGGGLGMDVIKHQHTTLSIIGGITHQHEKFFTSESGGYYGLIGEVFGKQFGKRIRLDHNLTFYPDFSQTGQYRFDTTTVFSFKLNNRLSLNSGVIDLYLSNPPAGDKENNLTFTTGIGFTF